MLFTVSMRLRHIEGVSSHGSKFDSTPINAAVVAYLQRDKSNRKKFWGYLHSSKFWSGFAKGASVAHDFCKFLFECGCFV